MPELPPASSVLTVGCSHPAQVTAAALPTLTSRVVAGLASGVCCALAPTARVAAAVSRRPVCYGLGCFFVFFFNFGNQGLTNEVSHGSFQWKQFCGRAEWSFSFQFQGKNKRK